MKYCEKCGIYINSNKVKCPLCKSILVEKEYDGKVDTYCQSFPDYSVKRKDSKLVLRIFILISILVGGLAIIVNFLFFEDIPFQGLWFIPIALLIISFWILIKGCILDYHHFNYNFALLVVFLLGVCITTEYLSNINFNANNISELYVVPIVIVIFIFSLSLRSLIRPKHFNEDFGYIFLGIVISIAYMIVLSSIQLYSKEALYTTVFSSYLSLGVFLAMFIIAPKRTIIQIKKLFFI
jgi:hypothetical protein